MSTTPSPADTGGGRAPPYIGVHLSAARGFAQAGRTALAIGADTLSVFLRNPRGGRARAFDADDMLAFGKLLREKHFAPVVAHAPYTMNIAAEPGAARLHAAEMLAEDLTHMEYMPGNLYCLHPGTFHTGADGGQTARAQAITRAAGTLALVLQPGMHTAVLLETMSGGAHELGGNFEELRAILDGVPLREATGICLDTCHIFAAGYDIKNDLDGVLAAFDRVLGLGRLKAVHLNDSQYPLGSRRDRHAPFGAGAIGAVALARLMLHPALCHLPFLTETHMDPEGHRREIARIRMACAAITEKERSEPTCP